MRKYSPIWKQLKEKQHCAITAPAPLHPRIIKAVTAEKYRDIAYKLLMAEERKRVTVEHLVDGSRIRFFLRVYSILEGIGMLEL